MKLEKLVNDENIFKEDCPNPTFNSIWETDLRVYQHNQHHVSIRHKDRGEKIIVGFVSENGRDWFAERVVNGARVRLGDYNYARFIDDDLALINLAIANNHLRIIIRYDS